MTHGAGTFNRGSNAGTARCRECGELRQRANIDGSTGLCSGTRKDGKTPGCYDKAGDNNSVADGWLTPAEYHETYGEHSDYCPDDCEEETK